MEKKITKVILPNKPHLDPIAAYYLLIYYGGDKFSGIREAKVSLWASGENPTEEQKKEWEEKGVLCIDIGEGQFDHHGSDKSVSLVTAEILKIQGNLELRQLLEYVQEDDKSGLHNRYGELPYIIKQMNQQNIEIGKIIYFVFSAINALKSWDNDLGDEFEKNSKIVKIKRYKKKLNIALIHSDSLNISKFALQKKRMALVIQQRSAGHILIFTNKVFRIDLRDIIAAIRIKELKLLGKDVSDIENKISLSREGKFAGVENWYYHKSLNAILNGSDAFSKTKPTKISFDDIVKIVCFGISSEFPKFCPEKGCLYNKCPYFIFDFYKCYRKKKEVA